MTAVEEPWRYVLSVDGRDIELSDGEVTLGRSRTATVRVDHESVSRSHALLTFHHGDAVVKDLNSSNGTYVGGRRVLNETRLASGDRIQLGAAVVGYKVVTPVAPADRETLANAEPPPGAAPAVPQDGGGLVAPGPLEISADELFRDVDRKARAEPSPGMAAAAALEAVRASIPAPPPPPSAPQPIVQQPMAPQPMAYAEPPPAPHRPQQPARPLRSIAREEVLSRVPLQHSGDLDPGDRAGVVNLAEAMRPAAEAAPAWNQSAQPENLAGFLPRLAATIVDNVILLALDLILLSPVFLVAFLGLPQNWIFYGITLLSTFVIFAANFWYIVGGWAKSGRTPGKSLVGLAIVTAGTAPGSGLGWKVAIVRAIGYGLSSIFGIGFIVALFRKDRRGWHDLLAGTWVVAIR